MASVSITQVHKRFGAVEALRGVDLAVGNGEFAVLVGPSGCGKTTLLRIIAGLETLDSGAIAIDGRVVNEVPPKDRDIAMVFQNYALYPHMTVRENLVFSLRLRGLERSRLAQRLEKVSRMLGLSTLMDRYPRQLSGGQRQRVAMGRAIMREPQVFLFDEPLSNIDANLRVRMRSQVKLLQQSLATTAIYVTHDQAEAMTMADRLVVINGGRVEQIGSPLEVYDRPANRFVAGFIGSPSMNFLDGTVRRLAGGIFFEAPGGARLPLPADAPGRDGQAAIYGFRPEQIELGGPDGVESRVTTVEPTGASTTVFSQLGDAEVCLLVNDRLSLRRGDIIRLRPRPERVRLFAAEGGAALN